MTCNHHQKGTRYQCIPIRTHILLAVDDICATAVQYAQPILAQSDLLFISKKAVACTQNRAIPLSLIKPRRLAVRLSRFVHKTPHGIGLGMPETMEMALVECGTLRILLAAALSLIGKIFRQKGWFYAVAGRRAAGIDGPCPCTLPPYNRYVVLTPAEPNRVAQDIAAQLHIPVAIVDINDFGGSVLGCSHKQIDKKHLAAILRHKPLGQGHQQTPMGLLRPIE